ncbi:MAG: prenyltransferase/squalene oxidase repeat-containing protein [Verrucomicrobiota bacterium]|jgi:squalene-hopene/tetraprenyl-beta-curcumene cyclase
MEDSGCKTEQGGAPGAPASSFHCPPSLSLPRLEAALTRAANQLLARRTPEGYWAGQLASSALSTAAAVTALAVVARESNADAASESEIVVLKSRLAGGLNWLAQHANADGGWGDTTRSLSNLSTTALCWAALGAVPGAEEEHRVVADRAEAWLAGKIGLPHASPAALAAALAERYGKDRTFSAPILTTCALAGRLGSGREAWRQVVPLPFELAALPRQWFAALRLPVVSYALPALIAIGQARHFHLPSANPLARLARALAQKRTLKVLREIQPSSGGFLEATPLTSFVVLSLAGSGQVHHPVTSKGLEFLLRSQRADGSWPIDTNLATWVTTLAINALAHCQSPIPDLVRAPSEPSLRRSGQWAIGHRQLALWLLGQQYRAKHPYTCAAPGGWAWTPLPGGVPDADDTAGAVLALWQVRSAQCEVRPEEVLPAARAGIQWLLALQNRDGGIPTFCRGWGALPFDRSSADLTAHALRAWLAWLAELPAGLQQRVKAASARALRFLQKAQRQDGAWVPLWFGNQFSPADENPTYGTARVVRALCEARRRFPAAEAMLGRGSRWLLGAQDAKGGWGGARSAPPSVEETALAVEALATLAACAGLPPETAGPALRTAILSGTDWLLARVESGLWTQPAPIGLYFARLWYYEELYPQIFTVSALGRVALVAEKLQAGYNSCLANPAGLV